MRIKKYVASTMQQAIARIKADFGDEAVILHTRRLRRGGFLGLLGKPRVEVIAAVEPGRPAGAKRKKELERAQEATAEALRSLQEEIRSLRQLVGERSQEQASQPTVWKEALLRLRQQDVPEEECQALIERARASCPDDSDSSRAWEELAEQVASGIATVPPWDFSRKPVIVPLVGPTGVGKTTTIAKLAANFAMLAKRSVGLVTVDTYRIAAVDQLRAYANLIGIELKVAYTPAELRRAVDELSQNELVLIDTAGRSHRHAMHMAELRSFLEALPEAEVHLVISATTRVRDMEEIVTRFADTGYERLIVTKLDESTALGPLYMLPRLAGKPLSYLTTGQTVPDDIEIADARHLARLLLGDKP
ncbi:MAG: flagellar biosynthesis protein FlhF [Firmicutes bacterium]|nr:flagellar biosynthesis protein FlhF [Bacillota bacterium]